MKQTSFQKGFSFVEIMVAVAILAIGIIPIFIVFSQGSSGTIMTRDETFAHQYASEMIDLAMMLGYDHPILTTTDNTAEIPADSLPLLEKGDSRFQRVLSIEEIRPSGGLADWPMSYKVLIARVTWESSGVKKGFNLSSLLFRGFNGKP